MKKKKAVIIILSALIVVVIAVAIILALTLGSGKSYTDYIEIGEKYMAEENYDEAIAAYQSAIEMDETGIEGHEGLARAYLATNRESLALSTLQGGIRLTDSDYLQDLLLEMFPSFAAESESAAAVPETEAAAGEEKVSDVTPVLNESLLSFISGANYSDYKQRYGTASINYSEGVSTVLVNDIDVTLTYQNSNTQVVINASSGEPYNEFMPNTVAVNQIALLFGGADTMNCSVLETLSGVTKLAKGDTTVSFEAYGCQVTISCDGNGLITADSWNEVIPLGTSNAASKVKLSGRVLDATTGLTLSGAQIKAYKGYGTYGTPVTATSEFNGNYSMDLVEGGNYTVTVEKVGYIRGEFEVYVLSNGNTTNEDFVISPEMSGDQMRIVLTWGSTPSDLDSYLMGTTDAGQTINTNFQNKVSRSGDNTKLAELDVDDTDGYGPETTTLYDINGVYEFVVVDFTGSGTMSSSGAKVTIYSGNSVVAVIDICSGLENGWKVCKIDHGNVTVINSSAETFNGMPK